MKRTILAAGLGIVAFAGVSFTAVYFATRYPEPGAEPPPPAAVAPAPQTAGSAPVAPTPPGLASRRDDGTARATPRPSGRDRSQVADRVTRKAVRKALSESSVQTRLARCVDRDIGFGSTPGTAPRGRPAALLLDLKAREHDLLVVGVSVERWGEASDDTVSCALEVLRGMVIAASPREPGQNLKVPFPLNPKKETLAVRR